jgi:orotate phosphoribosyltransferase
MVSIFTYSFGVAKEAFEKAGVVYYPMTSYPVMISLAIEKGIVTPEQESILLKWKDDPSGWAGF